MKKYYLANPFSMINHGITNYVKSAEKVLQHAGVDVQVISSEGPFRRAEFEKKIIDSASGGIVEIPDTQGMFANGCSHFDLHVRLHAPILKLEAINQKKQSTERFSREVSLIQNASMVSSPTRANALAYAQLGVPKSDQFLIFPNPLDFSEVPARAAQRDIDVIFIGRHERLKGVDHLRQILMHYPAGVRCAILGVHEQYKDYFSQDKFQCTIDFVGWTDNALKYAYLARSKVCLMLSRFESYSMVVAEALACGCNVFAWNTAGAPEVFGTAPVRFIEKFDVRAMAAASLGALSEPAPSEDLVTSFITHNNERYVHGVQALIAQNYHSFFLSNTTEIITPSVFPEKQDLQKVTESFVRLQSERSIKLAGVSMNSESAENMWGCLLQRTFSDYYLISRHPLGTYYKKGFDIFPVDASKYTVKDWFSQPEQVAKDIASQDAQVLFLFNGNTQAYRELVSRIYDQCDMIPVFSELGWRPQTNHVYFDIQGANAHSSLRSAKLESLCGPIPEKIYRAPLSHQKALLTLQLPGDTTLQKDSFPKALTHQKLIAYAREKIPKEIHLLIRVHPMDKQTYCLDGINNASFDTASSFAESVKTVDAVIGVNSTILIEAMEYPVNIYALGYGIFSDKNLVQDCVRNDLQWLHEISFDSNRREAFLTYLSERQLNVSTFSQKTLEECSEALYPIYLSMVIYESEKDLGVRHGRPRGYIPNLPKTKKKGFSQNTPKAPSAKIHDTKNASYKFEQLERKIIGLQSRIERLEAAQWMILKFFFYSPRALSQTLLSWHSSKHTVGRKIRKLLHNPRAFFIDFVLKHKEKS